MTPPDADVLDLAEVRWLDQRTLSLSRRRQLSDLLHYPPKRKAGETLRAWLSSLPADEEIHAVDSAAGAREIIKDRPHWVSRLLSVAPDLEDYLYERTAEPQERRLINLANDIGLPLRLREDLELQLQGLVQVGALEKTDTGWRPTAGGDAVRLVARRRGAAGLDLLVLPQRNTVAVLGGEQLKLYRASDRQQLQGWIIDHAQGSQLLREALPRRLAVAPIGGLGDLRSWSAFIGAADMVTDRQQQERHPPSDWMPAGAGALCREVESQPRQEDAAPLRSAVQAHCSGALVHAGLSPSQHRLRSSLPALELYRPANPYAAPPRPMSRRRK